MKIVVTGSSGFIGSNVVQTFGNSNDVVGLDIVDGENTKIIIDCKSSELTELLEWSEIDLVIDCAARTDLGGTSLSDYDDNFKVIERLIGICNQYDIKLIAFSSMLVNRLPVSSPIDFNSYNPNTIYGQSKVLYERTLKEKSKSFIIVRPTSIWGPGFKEPYRNFFTYVINNKFFVSDTSVLKTYCYIGNLLEQLMIIIENYKEYESTVKYFIDGNYNIYEWALSIKTKHTKSNNVTIRKVPNVIFFVACILGDFIKIFTTSFPLSTFRYKNLHTDNVIDLKYSLFERQTKLFTIDEGINTTLDYLRVEELKDNDE